MYECTERNEPIVNTTTPLGYFRKKAQQTRGAVEQGKPQLKLYIS